MIIILLLGLSALLYDVFKKKSQQKNLAPASKASFFEVGLVLWVIFILFSGIHFIWAYVEIYFPEINLSTYIGFLVQFVLLGFLFIIVKKYPNAISLPLNNPETKNILLAVLKGLFFFLASIPIVWLASLVWKVCLYILQEFNPSVSVEHQELITSFTQSDSPIFKLTISIFAILLAPINEELIFRGILYRYLKKLLPKNLSLILSACFFSLAHFNMLSFLPLFALGILLARAYERSGNIITSITFHACFNLNTLILLGFQPELNLIK